MEEQIESKIDNNIIPHRYSVPDVIAEIMSKVWCYDISFIHDLNGNCLPAKDKAYIKKSVETGTAMRVMTHPELREYKDSDICVKEYFIAVTIPGISYEFYILNCKSCLHKTYNDLKDWLIAQELSDLCDS